MKPVRISGRKYSDSISKKIGFAGIITDVSEGNREVWRKLQYLSPEMD
jgi:hypothetical protein